MSDSDPVASSDPVAASDGADLRHRLANIFQQLATAGRLRVQRAQGEETRRQLSWMVDTIGVVGILQQRLLRPDGEDFAGLLEEIAPQWRRRCGARAITVVLETEPVSIREQNLSALTLIAHELVINAIAHAFPGDRAGCVRITLRRVDDATAAFAVSDDGCGYDPQSVDRTRLGLWLMDGLAAQVRGRLTTSAGADGVTTRIEFAAPPLA